MTPNSPKLSPAALKLAASRIDNEQILREILRRKARTSLSIFARAMWPTVRPGVELKWNWHLDVVCRYLEYCSHPELHNRPERLHKLLINIPPGSMKSLIVGVFWPAWVWLTKPYFQFIFGTYQHQLTIRDANECHKLMETEIYRPYIAPGCEWNFDTSQDTKNFYRNNKGGHRVSTSVDGGGTGYRAHCFPAGTLVATEHGPLDIASLVELQRPPRVWAHSPTGPVLRQVLATRIEQDQRVGTITFTSGQKIKCTSEHPIFTAERGYVRAKDLRAGDTICRDGSLSLPAVQSPDRSTVLRSTKTNRGAPSALLQQALLHHLSRAREAPTGTLRDMRNVLGVGRALEVLQRSLRAFISNLTGLHVPHVPVFVSSDRSAHDLLWDGMRGRSALTEDETRGKSSLHRRDTLRNTVPAHEGSGLRKRSVFVRDLRNTANASSTSHRRESSEQRAMESRNDVSWMSQHAPSIQTDTVAEPWSLCPGEVTVYDIQVEADHNFFADGVLVHNCIVFDDPMNVKKAPTAESLTATIDWWEQRMSTRENNPGQDSFIGIMQRMHEIDLVGFLLEKDRLQTEIDPEHESYTLVKIPAYKNLKDSSALAYPEDPRTEEGENFFPERFPEKALKAVKTSLGPTGFEAQFQQNPAPASGGIFECANLKLWVPHNANLSEYPRLRVETRNGEGLMLDVVQLPHPDELSQWIQSWDCAFKDEKDSDYVCGQTWAYHAPNFYMMGMDMRRMNVTETMNAIIAMNNKYPQAYPIYIEDKANGSAVISMLKGHIPGIEPVNPEGGKIARANAVAPFVRTGNVVLPHPTLCRETLDLIAQLRMFPKGHDDAVDAMSQGLNKMGLYGGNYLSNMVKMFEHGMSDVFRNAGVDPFGRTW